VKDVELAVGPYKSRTAFTNLSSLPTIYLNEYLIDDEEILEYLILRELIHIRLHMYRSKYTGGSSYAEKFTTFSTSILKEKVATSILKEKVEKNGGEQKTWSMTSFSFTLLVSQRRLMFRKEFLR
jgi:hypothetical protein